MRKLYILSAVCVFLALACATVEKHVGDIFALAIQPSTQRAFETSSWMFFGACMAFAVSAFIRQYEEES